MLLGLRLQPGFQSRATGLFNQVRSYGTKGLQSSHNFVGRVDDGIQRAGGFISRLAHGSKTAADILQMLTAQNPQNQRLNQIAGGVGKVSHLLNEGDKLSKNIGAHSSHFRKNYQTFSENIMNGPQPKRMRILPDLSLD